ncbi:phage tail tape measure protein [Labedaea rhizosphaerae]|uniref:Minor tail protein n=1 Tax=Labedaea rhizosphaerae TaxID=598644 RepID=A0A4R6RUA7_LABRH|nr:phage tail tape measure protein [Labedaea rhizosphaerae]TDP90521.1 minor tail protein [Labedaea rhizosphaerae]
MALMVGEIQALITADASKFKQETDKALATGKKFRSDASRPVEINGDGKPFADTLNKADANWMKTVQSIGGKHAALTADDKVSPVLKAVNAQDLPDKSVALNADDNASPAVDKIKREQIPAKKVPVEVDDQTAEGTAKIGESLTKWAAGLGLGALIAKGIATGLDISDARTALQNQMGLSTQDAERYGALAGKVYADGFAESRDQVVEAISSASSNFAGFMQLTEDAQDAVAKAGIRIANVFGQDVTGVMRAAGAMVASHLAPDIQTAMDTITTGLQSAANKSDDLLDTFNEYSPFFAKVGLSASESLGLMNAAILAGARDSDQAADAIKEFTLRATDGSATTADGFNSIGLSAQEMSAAIAAGGDSAHGAFIKTLAGLQSIQDPLERNRIGVELMGSQWEDAFNNALPAMDLTKIGMDNIAGSTDRLHTSSSQMFSVIMRGFQEWAPAVGGVVLALGALPGAFGTVKDVATSTWEKVTTGLTNLNSKMGSGWKTAGLLAGGFGVAGLAAAAVSIGIGELVDQNERAAQAEAEHQQRVQALAAALRESNGAIDDNVRAIAAKNLAETQVEGGKTMLEIARETGVALPDLTDAYLGNADAIERVRAAGNKWAADQLNGAGSGEDAMSRARTIADYTSKVNGLNGEFNDGVQAEKNLAAATKEGNSAQQQAAAATEHHTQALKELQDLQLGFADKNLAYRSSVAQLGDAQQRLADATKAQADALKAHGKNSAEYKQASADAAEASRGAESAMLGEVRAAGELAKAENAGKDQKVIDAAVTKAQTAEIIKLAEASGNHAPLALRQMIASLDATSLAALGVTRKVTNTGDAIYELPDGKTVTIKASDFASGTLDNVANKVNSLHDKTVTVKVKADMAGFYHSVNAAGQQFGVPFYAKGTDYHPGGLAVVGEHGPELLNLPKGSQVIPAAPTRDLMRPSVSSTTSTATSTTHTDRSRHVTYNIEQGLAPHEVVRVIKRYEAEQMALYGP